MAGNRPEPDSKGGRGPHDRRRGKVDPADHGQRIAVLLVEGSVEFDQFDKPPRRPRRRLGDCFRVTVIVLLRLHVGAHILRRHQPDLEAGVAQQAAKVMCSPASLHRDCHRLQLGHDFEDIFSAHAPPHHDLPGAINAREAAYVLA
jgi:hypothetical protein